MKAFKIVVAAIVVIVIGGVLYYLFGNYSDGYRGGTMIKFSKKGFITKTYEGQLNLGMVLNDDPGRSPAAVASVWEFSVPAGKDQVIKTLEEALLTGKRVKLHYNEKFIQVFWRGDTKYMVDEAEIIQ